MTWQSSVDNTLGAQLAATCPGRIDKPKAYRLCSSLASIRRELRNGFIHRPDEPRDDLVSALAQTEEAGDALSEEELIAMVFLLLAAGHEPTINLIGNGILALLEHPDQMPQFPYIRHM